MERYGDFQYGPERETAEARLRALEYKIKEREQQVTDFLVRADAYVSQGVLVGESDQNARHYIDRVRELDPNNKDLTVLLDRLRDERMAAALALVDEEKIVEAKVMYDELRVILPDFRHDELETRMTAWLEEKVVKPQMAKLEQAVKRRKWDQAFSITEDLRPKMPQSAASRPFLGQRDGRLPADLQRGRRAKGRA